MTAAKVSVVIPNYNHGPYLRQRIESVLGQTYQNFEVIILDDCSTDNSAEIIREYAKSPQVKEVLLNDKNSGNPFLQWKIGISLASGDWVWIAESDDYADEHFLEMMMKAIAPYENVGLAYCDSKIISDGTVATETFATIKNKRFNTVRWSDNYTEKGQDEIENYLLPGGTINNSSAVLFNRKILMDVNPFDIEFRYIGDKYAFVKVLASHDVVYVKDSMNYYRDPFNAKHIDKFVFYFYEQFVVFNWVYRNLKITDKDKFLKGFYANTRNSLFRDWNAVKVSLYVKLFKLNRYLMLKNMAFNFSQSIGSLFRRMESAP